MTILRQKALAGDALDPGGSLIAMTMESLSPRVSWTAAVTLCSSKGCTTFFQPEKANASKGNPLSHLQFWFGLIRATANSNGDASSWATSTSATTRLANGAKADGSSAATIPSADGRRKMLPSSGANSNNGNSE